MNPDIHFWRTRANLDLLKETKGYLWWSYQQLEPDIRRCFAYCSTFPRGYKLERDKLVRMWIAQGFIVNRSNGTEDMEDIGLRYFHQLVAVSFLQYQCSSYGMKYFIIHDVLHELAETVAGSDFFRIEGNGCLPKKIPPEARHVFVQIYGISEITEDMVDMANLRTLIIQEHPSGTNKTFPNEGRDLVKIKLFKMMFERLRKLRVLIVQISYLEEVVFTVPESIGQMKHLRYLGFQQQSNHRLKVVFPRAFCRLYHLQNLDASEFKLSSEADIYSLVRLRHIKALESLPNIGRLTSLMGISFTARNEQGYELQQLKFLNKLRTLSLHGLGTVVRSEEEALKADLGSKEQLAELRLVFGSNASDSCSPADQVKVLEGLCPPEGLHKLIIWFYSGSEYPRWILSSQHPQAPKQLYEFLLFGCSRFSIPEAEDSDFFTGLRKLHIVACDWDALPHNLDRLKSLKKLAIDPCRRIKHLPKLPQSLVCLKIRFCPELWMSCQDREHDNWERIRHIHRKELVRWSGPSSEYQEHLISDDPETSQWRRKVQPARLLNF